MKGRHPKTFTEFDFRYNNRSGLGVNDRARADKLLKGITGKRIGDLTKACTLKQKALAFLKWKKSHS